MPSPRSASQPSQGPVRRREQGREQAMGGGRKGGKGGREGGNLAKRSRDRVPVWGGSGFAVQG
eukprot:1633202-Rhodomonas_salina.1